MKISFCTTCKNRLFQLKETIIENLESIKNDGNAELILVNYDDDLLENFVLNELSNYINTPYFIYLRKFNSPYFEFSKAKNLAHFAASGEFVFNLDCDNYIGNTIQAYRDVWKSYPNSIIHGLSKTAQNDGSYGRIGLSKEKFIYLGGYDEEIIGIYEDGDLIQRCFRLNMPYAHVLGGAKSAISNSRLDTIANLENPHTFDYYFNLNKSISSNKLNNNHIVRNSNRIKVGILKNFSEQIWV